MKLYIKLPWTILYRVNETSQKWWMKKSIVEKYIIYGVQTDMDDIYLTLSESSCLQETKAFKTNDSESYLFLNMSKYKKEHVKQGSKHYCTAQRRMNPLKKA